MRDRIRRGDESAEEIVEGAIRNAEQLNTKLNFLASENFQAAIETARRIDRGAIGEMPFAGLPFLVKDLKDAPGLPTRAGSRSRSDAPLATAPDPYIERFTSAGLVVIGKSATSEFGFLPTTEALANGATRNPWDRDLSAGGSSGGAAVAVASGVVPIAHASDGGGSIRIPAAFCGVFGLKPSRGRLLRPRGPTRAIEIAVQNVVSRSVRDSAAMLALTEAVDAHAGFTPIGMVEPDQIVRKLRIGVAKGAWSLETETAIALETTGNLLEDLGHEVSLIAWPFGDSFIDDFLDYWSLAAESEAEEFKHTVGRGPTDGDFEPFTLHMAEKARRLSAAARNALVNRLRSAAAYYDYWISPFDVVVSPITTSPPPRLGWLRGDVPFDTLLDRLRRFAVYTPIHNFAGAPAMSVPIHWTSQGMPIGVQFFAARGGEAVLLKLAYALERARPWAARDCQSCMHSADQIGAAVINESNGPLVGSPYPVLTDAQEYRR
jgi:amidase